MKTYKTTVFILTLAASFCWLSCRIQNANPQNDAVFNSNVNSQIAVTPTPAFSLDEGEEISFDFDELDSVRFGDYKIEKVTVKKKDKTSGETSDITDAVLSKKGKNIARFEGEFYPAGNKMAFARLSFLGSKEKQLVVRDSVNRGDHNWILSFSPRYAILFDSNEYEIYRGDLQIVDIDKDGVYEFILPKEQDGSLGFPYAYIPRVRIAFKYDEKTNKFLPANAHFQAFVEKDIAEDLERFKRNDKKKFSDLLEITLAYIYAGREDEAWKFYEREYVEDGFFLLYNENQIDKEQRKELIKKALSKDPIYKSIKKDLIN